MHVVLFVVVFGLVLIVLYYASFSTHFLPCRIFPICLFVFVCCCLFVCLLLLLFKIGDVLVVTCRYFSHVLCFDKRLGITVAIDWAWWWEL